MDKKTTENKLDLFKDGELNATQKLVSEEIAYKSITGKTEEDIAKEYNVNRTTIWRWKSKQEFNAEVNRIAAEIQKSKQIEVYAVLDKLLKSNNEKTQLKAVELLSRQLGLFKDVIQNEVTVEKKVNVDDLLKELENM